ncbi:MAG: ATP-dependent DNA helicase [Polyangiales bacterium]
MDFTPTQLEAIGHRDGHLQLIACAGSGKTEVVARRVVELLRPRADVAPLVPRNIVAFTFTEKAAAELKDRIVRRVRDELGPTPGMAEMYVGTIHGFCKTLLNEEVPAFLKFDVLNQVQQALFVDRYSNQSGLSTSRDLQGRALVRYKDTGRYIDALDILRQAELRPEKLADNTVAQGLGLYRKLLDTKCYLDFTAIMEHALRVLRDDAAVRARLAARVKHVIVDEYQDVNPIQEKVVGALAGLGAWLCVVGDDDQTIFQWNGADVRNILSFATRYPDVRTVRLEENFRSSRAVVEVARDFIAQNANRLPKAMRATDAQPSEAGDVLALGLKDPDDEAAFIVRTIQALHGTAFTEGDGTRGLAWSDFAILVRSNLRKNAAPIVKALAERGIPYLIQGMNTLFDTREANAARALFYFLVGRNDLTEDDLRTAWRNAELGLTDADLDRALALVLDRKARLADPGQERWNVYNLQRLFLDVLEAAQLREERVPGGRGEVVFYNLGQFSQLISDFETIHFHSKPLDKYEAFASFLQYGAEGEYAEGLQKNAYANPDAVRVLTVHKAKGLQWPAVFVPGVLRNRFPMAGIGGATAWHLLPEDAVVDAARYRGGPEDERRLFYVAMTRAQRYLFVTWAPVPGNNRAQKPSEFVEWLHGSKWVKRFERGFADRPRAAPTPRESVSNVTLSFSELKYFFECPYQFKLRVLYGFNAPLAEALGYGRSLHNALAEIHKRALEGRATAVTDVPDLLDTHLHLPYAYPEMKDTLRESGAKVLQAYLTKNKALLAQVEFAEKSIEIALGGGVTVAGRIDLVYRRDTDETSVVDLKSTARAQAEDVTETQLHIYALGYQELTARDADYVEIWELEEQRKKPRAVDHDFIDAVKSKVAGAASSLRKNHLPVAPWAPRCKSCDYCTMCSAGSQAAGGAAPAAEG